MIKSYNFFWKWLESTDLTRFRWQNSKILKICRDVTKNVKKISTFSKIFDLQQEKKVKTQIFFQLDCNFTSILVVKTAFKNNNFLLRYFTFSNPHFIFVILMFENPEFQAETHVIGFNIFAKACQFRNITESHRFLNFEKRVWKFGNTRLNSLTYIFTLYYYIYNKRKLARMSNIYQPVLFKSQV